MFRQTNMEWEPVVQMGQLVQYKYSSYNLSAFHSQLMTLQEHFVQKFYCLRMSLMFRMSQETF
jgi:hypothetical protein